MTDSTDPIETRTVWAKPYTARKCPECGTWVYVDDGPFAEGDRTKTVADWLHWQRFHLDEEPTATTIGFPYFDFNITPIEAILETPAPEPATSDDPAANEQGTVMERHDHLQHRPDPEPPGSAD